MSEYLAKLNIFDPGLVYSLFHLSGHSNDKNNQVHRDYKIFLHEEDQLLLSEKDVPNGQSNPIFLPVGTDLEGSFTVTKKTRLNKESSPNCCIEDHI